MRLIDADGKAVATYELANPGAVHTHGGTDRFTVPQEGTVRLAVPASARIERVICEYDADAHDRGADASPAHYAEPFVFDIGKQVRALLQK